VCAFALVLDQWIVSLDLCLGGHMWTSAELQMTDRTCILFDITASLLWSGCRLQVLVYGRLSAVWWRLVKSELVVTCKWSEMACWDWFLWVYVVHDRQTLPLVALYAYLFDLIVVGCVYLLLWLTVLSCRKKCKFKWQFLNNKL